MKIRIQGNSIRLRLTQTEVENISKGKVVQESVPFGPEQPSFQYLIQAETDSEKISVSHADHAIKVELPLTKAKQWADTDQVGLEENIAWKDQTTLYILVEKDFQCLHRRPAEDESDNFPNPAAEA